MELGSTSGPGHRFSRDLYESFGPGTPAALMEWALGSRQFSEDELRGAYTGEQVFYTRPADAHLGEQGGSLATGLRRLPCGG